MRISIQLIAMIGVSLLQMNSLGCTPTIAIKAPKEPIVINLNIKVEHAIRMEVDRDLAAMIEEEKELF